MSRITRSLAALAVAGLAAGCGSGSAAPGAATAATGGAPVPVSEREFAIDGVPATLAAGTYTFAVTNAGAAAHDLTVEGGGDSQATDRIAAGGTGSVTVTLKPGVYQLYCSIPGHRAAGMDARITVQ